MGDMHGISRSRVLKMRYGGMAGPALFCLQVILLASVPGEGAAPIGSLRRGIGRGPDATGSVSELGRDIVRRRWGGPGLRLVHRGEAADAGEAEGGSGWRVSSLRGGIGSGADSKDKIAENGSSAKRAPVVFRSHSAVERENKREVGELPSQERAERMIDPAIVDRHASLDDYDIDWSENGVLGSGAYSTVRVATHKKSGRRIAIKAVDLVTAEADTIVRLQREIQVLRAIKSPNIIELYEVMIQAGKLYMVMELCTGGELWQFLQDVKIMPNGDKYFKSKTRGMVALTEDKIASLVRGIVEAVAFCHERKVCHRDLKLENLMLEHTGEDAGVKLIDFGFSKIFNSTEGMFAVLGSPYYVAHEVLVVNPNQKTGYGPAADMWSIGVITYMLLTGQAPFDGKDDYERLDAVRRGTFTFPEDAKLSAHAVGFVAGCLFLDPEKRITAAGALEHPWLEGVVRSGAKPDVEETATKGRNIFSKIFSFLCR